MKSIEELEKTIKLLEKKVLLLQTELETALAKAKLDCQQKLEDQRNKLLIDFKHEKENWKEDKQELESKIKKGVDIVIQRPRKPRKTSEKVKAIIDVITET